MTLSYSRILLRVLKESTMSTFTSTTELYDIDFKFIDLFPLYQRFY